MIHDEELCSKTALDGLPVCNACRIEFLRSKRRRRENVRKTLSDQHADLSTVTELSCVLGSALIRIAMRSGLEYDTESKTWIKR